MNRAAEQTVIVKEVHIPREIISGLTNVSCLGQVNKPCKVLGFKEATVVALPSPKEHKSRYLNQYLTH